MYLCISVYMLVCGVHISVQRGMYILTSTCGGQISTWSVIILQVSSILVLETGCLTWPGTCALNQVDWPVSPALESPAWPSTLRFYLGAGDHDQSSFLPGKYVTKRTISPALVVLHFNATTIKCCYSWPAVVRMWNTPWGTHVGKVGSELGAVFVTRPT